MFTLTNVTCIGIRLIEENKWILAQNAYFLEKFLKDSFDLIKKVSTY